MMIWLSLAISITFRSCCPLPARMGGGREGEVVWLRGLAAHHDLEPHHFVREMQDAIELGDDARIGRELDDDVVALVLTVDLEHEPASTPAVDVADRSTAVGDGLG